MEQRKVNVGRLVITSGKIAIGRWWFLTVFLFFAFAMMKLNSNRTTDDPWGELVMLTISLGVLLFFALLTAVECRTIVLSKEGCEILWWKYRKFWTWDEMKHRCWVEYPDFLKRNSPQNGHGVIWLCTKPVDIAYLADASTMSVFGLMSRVGIHFLPKGYNLDTDNHSFSFAVDKDTFMNFTKTIGLRIEDIDMARCAGE